MLNYILHHSYEDVEALSDELWPDRADCEAVFGPVFGEKAYRFQRKVRRKTQMVIRPRGEDQTSYLIWETDSVGLAEYSGDAPAFPGGYREIGHYLRAGYPIYRFKFVKPGEHRGAVYDVLVYVNGRWKMIHRPWMITVE
ncbi:hypothetical protein [Pontibacter sp. G13]|uniref:hypothetical protein n=1 Tax=Pontibacter sp. G13 TaxID=3074898 RepID=UPI0028896190|nr:hypothetical protein [Pontibacter sp. G13]WNJ19464.1 hypothetical protein RJD25_03135 [Pontibacter sp. G13]